MAPATQEDQSTVKHGGAATWMIISWFMLLLTIPIFYFSLAGMDGDIPKAALEPGEDNMITGIDIGETYSFVGLPGPVKSSSSPTSKAI